MDKWTSRFSKSQLELLNACRFFLKVTTITDIATLDGRHIEDWAWKVNKPGRTSRLKWSVQPRPPKAAVLLWQKALRDFFGDEIALYSPLGMWQQQNYQRWTYFQNILITSEVQNLTE